MEPDRLKCFIVAADCLNFTKAGERLFLTQSGVSYQISALEQSLGFKLFHRDSRRVQLTQAGAFFLETVRGVMATYDLAVEQARKFECGTLGRISLGYLGGIEKKFIPIFLRRFHREHPEITVQLQPYSIATLLRAVEEGAVDIGFTLMVESVHQRDLEVVKLFSDIPSVIMRPDHPLASRTSLTVQDLEHEPMVALAPEYMMASTDWRRDLFTRHGLHPDIVRTTTDPGTLLMLVESGLGIAILTRHILSLLPNANLRYVDLVSPGSGVDSVAIWKRGSDNLCLPIFLRALGIRP